MRKAVTIAETRDGKTVLLCGVEVPLTKQRLQFKEALRLQAHPEFREAMILTTDGGRVMRKRFATPERAAALAAAIESSMRWKLAIAMVPPAGTVTL